MTLTNGRTSGTPIAPPPLVGRAREQRLLREHLAGAIGGHGRLVIIGGEAGIGKTTLARDLAQEATAQDVCVLSGHCYNLTATPPFGLWLDLAADYRPTPDLPPLPMPLATGRIDEIEHQAALFAEVRAFVAALCAFGPVMLVLEDLHWADPASLELLRHLGSRLAALPVLLVVTYRIDELTRRHPFYQQLPALIRESEGVRIDLHRLDPEDFRRLVAAHWRLPAGDEDRLVAYLDAHAEGNPFFALELLRTLEEDGLLRANRDGWELAALDRVVVPSLVRQVIDARVARLGEETREPLAIGATIGQEVPLALWARVAEIGEDALLATVERAVDARLLDASPDGAHVAFVHALTREALYDGVLPPRRRRWHRQVAEALIAADAQDPDAVAYHLQQASDQRAVDWLIRAGERAQRAYAWLTARDRFAAAADLLADEPGQEQTRGQLLIRCGRLQRYSNPAQALADAAEARRLAQLIGDRVLEAESTFMLGIVRCFAGDFRLGLEEITAGLAALEAIPAEEARPSWAMAAWLADVVPASWPTDTPEVEPAAEIFIAAGMHHRRGGTPMWSAVAGHYADARDAAEGFLSVVAGLPAGPHLLSNTAHAYFCLGLAYAALGQPTEARAAFTGAREVYHRLDHHAMIGFSLLSELREVVLPYLTTDPFERRRVAAEAETTLERASGAFPSQASPRRARLALLFLEGRWQEARGIAEETTGHDMFILRREITNVLASLAYHQGLPDQAWHQIRSFLPQGPAAEPGGIVFLDGLTLQCLAADLCLDTGDLAGATAWLEANDRWLAWNGAVLGQAENRLGWARWCRAAGDLGRACTLADQAIGAASEPVQPLALLATQRLRGELATAMGNTPAAEQDLSTALTLADACAAPYERALTLIALAELRQATGNAGEASTLLVEARAICEPLGARPALARIDALADRPAPRRSTTELPGGLTPREAEVLRLVAQGLTDAAVAERLFISPRTVSQHLRSIYAKLDLPSRAAATRFAVERGLT